VQNPKIPVKKIKDRGFATAPDGRLIIRDDNKKDSDVEGNKKKKKTSFLQNDSEDDYGKCFVITFRYKKKFTYHDDIERRFYIVEDEDDASIVTSTKNASKKRKYNESTLETMSVKSQSTSRYRGKFTSF